MNNDEQEDFKPVLKMVGNLIRSEYAFISNKGMVDVGEIQDVVVTKGGVTKIKIKGEITAIVTPDRLFKDIKIAYNIAIEAAEKEIKNIESNISAMRGRVKNLKVEEDKKLLMCSDVMFNKD